MNSSVKIIVAIRNAGHNKWSKIKRVKGSNDLNRAKLASKISRQITSAIKAGGNETDPSLNLYLSSALSQARQLQIPKATIEQALNNAKSSKSSSNDDLMTVVYEGMTSDGVACLVEALTSNRNKTFAEVRHVFTKTGSSMGSVLYLFKKSGFILIEAKDMEKAIEDAIETDLVLNFTEDDSKLELQCEVSNVLKLSNDISKRGYTVLECDVRYSSDSKVHVKDDSKFETFLDEMESLDEVVRVYHNAETDETNEE